MRPDDAPSIERALKAGMQHHDAGRLAEAEASYHEVLRAVPGHPDALALLGDVAHRSGRLADAISRLREAIGQRPGIASLHHKLGMVLADAGDLEAAANAHRAALRIKPDYAEAWLLLGNVLALQRRFAEAVAAYRRAIAASPRFAPAHNNLAAALESDGRWDEALAAYRAALAVADHADVRANIARCLVSMPRVPSDAATRDLVARAIEEAWMRPADLARLALGLLRLHPVLASAIDEARSATPDSSPGAAWLTPERVRACNEERLLAALLANAHASDPDIERFLTAARHALLVSATSEADAPIAREALPFACALARQCFFNDYVFATMPDEDARVARLAEDVEALLERSDMPRPEALAVLACYRPLGALPYAASLDLHPWPAPVRALIVQQVIERIEEARLADAMPALTPIEGDVSRQVQRQYEENPYPRWTKLPPTPPLPLDTYLRMLFPGAALPPRGSIADRDILIAGCGTGQESLDLARQFPASRILAVDLSRTSLAYAARKAREAGCTQVEHAQADLLALGSVARTFDVISSVGVLHHLADPLAGWRALAARLRPGGFMQVGLYSEIARRDITAARAELAAEDAQPDPGTIRRTRVRLLGDARWNALTRLRDFYGLNECRDLLFHVQEHCTTLPALRDVIASLDLRFIGLAVPPAVSHAFAQRFPDAAADDLERWHAFELEHPDTFAGMYVFWVHKPRTP
jgi:tetratricopeptide (TPR) repeat protein/2-polyprenyl-3-methyl-5-hydroxy-6-metoxy-1,4-benzoquinol methylase